MSLKDEYFTVPQAAKELDVTAQTILRWVRNKRLPAEKVGRESLIAKSAVIELRLRLADEFIKELVNWHLAADAYKPIREYFKYNQEDKIEMINPDRRIILVTKKDGTKDKVAIGAVRMGYNEKERRVEIELVAQEVKRSPYKETKRTSKSRKAE